MPQDITFTAQTPFVLTVSGEIDSAKEVVADLRPSAIASEAGALLASENLDDVDDPDVARANLGAVGVVAVTVFLSSVLSASGLQSAAVAPISGTIVGADLWASPTIAAGDLTATLSIGATPVTNGVMTLANGATSNTIGACTPTADNAVTARTSVIVVTLGGGNTAAGIGSVTVYIEPA